MDKHTEKVNDIEICTVPKGVLQYTHGGDGNERIRQKFIPQGVQRNQ